MSDIVREKLNKSKKIDSKSKGKNTKIKVSKNITEVFNIIDTKDNYFILKNNIIFDFLKIKTKNLNCSDDELNLYNLSLMKLLKTSDFDIKVMNMSFPTDVTEQIEYFNKLLDKTNNHIFKTVLHKKIDDLHKVNKSIVEKEFYISFFSKNIEEHIKNKNTIISILSVSGLVEELDYTKKEKILFKLNNMNSAIFN